MSGSKISVAMATFCGEKFLIQQLNSIKNQTHTPSELVICDDCSSDLTIQILEKFAKTAPFPVHIYRNDSNIGFIDNFFKVISLCQGDYIALSDQDDIWELNKIQVSLQELENSGAWLHSHSAELIDEQGRVTKRFKQVNKIGNITYKDFDPWNTFFGFTCTFKKDLLDYVPNIVRPPDLIYDNKLMAHDRWITTLALCTNRVIYSDVVLAKYRQHDGNVFSAKNRSFIGSALRARNKYVNYLSKRHSISEKMVETLESPIYASNLFEKSSTAMWIEHRTQYKRRLDLFINNKSGLSRLACLFSTLKFYRDYKSFLQDLIAILIFVKSIK